jgi:TPR repeat protein
MAAADHGHTAALHRAGCMLEQGCGGQADFQAALKYFPRIISRGLRA